MSSHCAAAGAGTLMSLWPLPLELCLELTTVVDSDFPYPEREILNDVIDEIDGIGLGMTIIDPEGLDARRIINGRELVTADFLATFAFESQELDIHLDMMDENLVIVTLCVHLAQPGSLGKAVQAVTTQDPIHPSIRD